MRQIIDWEKIFATHTSDKGQLSNNTVRTLKIQIRKPD